MLRIASYSLALLLLCAFASARPTTLSLAPVIDRNALEQDGDAISLRSSIIAELTESYDCVVLSRSNGMALLEEQRMLALNSLDPETFPYVPAADYVVLIDLSKASSGVSLRLNYTAVTGTDDADVKTLSLPFSSASDLNENGADVTAVKMAELLNLQPKLIQPATKAMFEGKAWGVLPWLDYTTQPSGNGARSVQLMNEAALILENELPGIEQLAPEAIAQSNLSMYQGATESQAAAIGNDVGADYLLAGSINETSEGTRIYAFVVRSQDAVVLAGREMLLSDGDDLSTNFALLIKSLLSGLPELPPLPESPAAANVEEAKLLYGIAQNMGSVGRYPTLDMYLAARMVAQDTYMEQRVLQRIPTVMHYHPNTFWGRLDWETKDFRPEYKILNQYVIDVLERTLPTPYSLEDQAILLNAYAKNGEWERALTLHDELVAAGEIDPRGNSHNAADYMNFLSLSGRQAEADAFYRSLDKQALGQSSYGAAANHYRRAGDDAAELACMTDRLENGYWQTHTAYWRFCDLLHLYVTPEEQIRLLDLFKKSIHSYERVQWQLIRANIALGNEGEAAALAQLLLARDKLDKTDFEDEAAFRAALKEIVGDREETWPTAVSIQPIPEEYKMYVQPVGDYDETLLTDAAAITAEFFGCEVVIQPSIPNPPGRSAYDEELVEFNSVPLLRHLTAVRPIPEDAIAQHYYVDRRFLVYGRGATMSVYRKGLGTMITPAYIVSASENYEMQVNRLAAQLIRHFRYYIERSQDISFDDSQNNRPCVNADMWLRYTPKMGYCPECVKNYTAADMQAVHAFAQANPLPLVYTKEYTAIPRFSVEEKKDIEAYMELVPPTNK